jgi:Ca2+-dependent lipid-binding protein
MLHVKVLNGRNLRRADFMGKSDPYVRISLGEGTLSKKTQVKKNTLNPDWNESFDLVVQDQNSQVLEFHAYDWEKAWMLSNSYILQ